MRSYVNKNELRKIEQMINKHNLPTDNEEKLGAHFFEIC